MRKASGSSWVIGIPNVTIHLPTKGPVMDATTAMNQTNTIVTTMVSALTPQHREMATPCDDWTVHELVGHMCEGVQGIAGGLQGQAPPAETPDFLADGPKAGWDAAVTAITAAATPDVLSAIHQMPFGEVPGEMAVSVIVADMITHAWDLAEATGIEHGISDELAQFALQTWKPLVPAEGRGDGFKAVIDVGDDASSLQQLLGYTGRQPSA
jgi:uncharacterized protein (TIGR03086 family)